MVGFVKVEIEQVLLFVFIFTCYIVHPGLRDCLEERSVVEEMDFCADGKVKV